MNLWLTLKDSKVCIFQKSKAKKNIFKTPLGTPDHFASFMLYLVFLTYYFMKDQMI